MTPGEHRTQFNKDVVKLLQYVLDSGYEFTIEDVKRLRKCPHCGKPLAKALSLHPEGLAIDINLLYKGEYLKDTDAHKPFGDFWKTLSPYNEWGGEGNRNDGNHYSRSPDGKRW